MPYYLQRYLIKFGSIFVITFVFAALYPRHTTVRTAYGLPFEYRSELRAQYKVTGLEEGAYKFNLSLLMLNVWILFLGVNLGWFALGTMYVLIRRLIARNFGY